MAKKAIAAGHICVDITPVFPEGKQDRLTDLLVPGKLLHMDGVTVSTGGPVANTGLAMKKLGVDMTLIAKIGDDLFGQMVLTMLKDQGYDSSDGMIISDEDETSWSVVLAVPGIDRIFLHGPGANATFCYEDLNFEQIGEADVFHFGYPPLLRMFYQNGGEALEKMFRKVKSFGTATSLDMCGVDPASEAGRTDWAAVIEQVLPFVDFFVPSVEELCFMLDRDQYDEWIRRADGRDVTEVLEIDRDVAPLAQKLMSMGAAVVMIKCGVQGLYYCTAGKERLGRIGCKVGLDVESWADRRGFENSYIPDEVLSGTGAGDTCIAAFLTAILRGESFEMCLHMAAAAGAACVAAYDALGGITTYEALRERVIQGWTKRDRI